MNKYNNNFNRSQAGDSPLRFNKRPRYGMNNNGGNSSPRFKPQNQSGYQYSPNRNRAADNYQSNQYEERSNRHFYANNNKRSNHHQQNNQSSPYSQKSANSSLSPSSSFTAPAITQNVIKFPSTQPNSLATPTSSATITAQNNQHQQQLTPNVMDSSNYYGFAYNNFYPTSYNADLIATVPSNPFGIADGISPFMWQTITSRLPPKLPQNHHLPLSQQQPPPILPPLPSSDSFTPLPPPPPMPESISESSTVTNSATENTNNKFHGQDSGTKTVIKMKAKRKAMSMRYKLSKSWTEKDVALALKAEESNTKKLLKDIILIIRFPDPEISREIVKCYSPDIESVHFQLNFAPRYCLVHLKPGADVEKTIDHLSKIPFGTGFLSVEVKQIPHKTHSTKPNEVDPFTLYVGNLPTTIACKTLKEHFPGAARIDIGFAQRMKYTRYAFIRYQTVEQAIEAYKRMLDAEIGGRTLTIRFRRLVASNEENKDGEAENHEDISDELFSQTVAAATEYGTSVLSSSENADEIAGLEDKSNADVVEPNFNDFPNENEKSLTETERNTDNNSDRENVSRENNLKTTSDSISEINSTESAAAFPEKSNIKEDPDIDPNDVVIRDKTITSHFNGSIPNIKQEEESLFLHMEFFEKPINQTNCSDKSIVSDRVSVSSTVDETDTMSTLSSNSLGEFLQTCQRAQIQANNIENKGPPPTKRNKITDATLPARIKREPLENTNIAGKRKLPLFPKENVNLVKQEAVEDSENLNTVNITHPNLHTVQMDPKSRETVAAHPCNKSTNNDDEVPATALFFRTDYRNMLTNSSNDCDYDEFYETRTSISSQESISLANIKAEPSTISTRTIIRKNTIENNDNYQTYQTLLNRPSVTSEKNSNINTTTTTTTVTTSTTLDDDDNLVPAQNLLGSYRPAPNVIKQETEHDDIFSVPFNKTNRLNDDVSCGDICNNNNNEQSNNNENTHTSEVLNSNVPEDNDDDVIIISDNIRRETRETRPNRLVLTNLFLPKPTDLVSLEHKSFPVSIPNYNLTKIIHRDDLDRLYDQLDADSDSEL